MQTYKTSKARENILGKIRKELNESSTPMPFPEIEKNNETIFVASGLSDEETFAARFSELGGKFIFCANEQELMDDLIMLQENREWQKIVCTDKRLIKLFQNSKIDLLEQAHPGAEEADACITGCEFIVARTGSILFSSKMPLGRTSTIFYPVHIVFAYANQIVPDLDACIAQLKRKYAANMPSMINLTTGPSRTADIEKTLVVGVHGPCEIFCFFINTDI